MIGVPLFLINDNVSSSRAFLLPMGAEAKLAKSIGYEPKRTNTYPAIPPVFKELQKDVSNNQRTIIDKCPSKGGNGDHGAGCKVANCSRKAMNNLAVSKGHLKVHDFGGDMGKGLVMTRGVGGMNLQSVLIEYTGEYINETEMKKREGALEAKGQKLVYVMEVGKDLDGVMWIVVSNVKPWVWREML